MKIPHKINIGVSHYDVCMVNSLFFKSQGRINYLTKKLKVRRCGNDPRLENSIFLHEVSHAIIKELEFSYPQLVFYRNHEVFIEEMGLHLYVKMKALTASDPNLKEFDKEQFAREIIKNLSFHYEKFGLFEYNPYFVHKLGVILENVFKQLLEHQTS